VKVFFLFQRISAVVRRFISI